jgi:dipeptidyl aminopeptidase/acylaminoacyl peptidase
MKNFFISLVLLIGCVSENVALASPLPIETFSKGSEYSNVKLSPDGDYLSAKSEIDGKSALFFIDLSSFSVTYIMRFDGRAQVGDYQWVNNKRVVLQKQYKRGWKEQPEYRGELFGVDFNGKNGRNLVGYNVGGNAGSRIKRAEPLSGTSYILDPLHNDKKHMLITTYPWGNSEEPFTRVYKVNVKTGKRKEITRAPVRMANYLTDHQGVVRFAASTTDYIDQSIFMRNSEKDDWAKLNIQELGYSNVTPYAFDDSGQYVYAGASKNGEPTGIYKFDTKTKSFELIHQDKSVDPSNVWIDDSSKNLYAIEHELGYPSYTFVDSNAVMTKRLKALLKTFNGEQVQIVSSSNDGDISIVQTFTDLNPGEFYLYRAKENKLSFLFASRSWVDKSIMAETKPIKFKTRDGLTIHGYLTLPFNKPAKNLPLVVMPHGGPHGPRDWWQWDPDAQLLANRGVAVLKVNFRGSGGYGDAFEIAGHQKWGAEIQYDIIDGVKYVTDQGIADKENICIMGASFGGYSALQSAIIEPDMFKCAIGVVGVYDLPLMFEEGDVSERDSGQRYLTEVLGTDIKLQKAFSPSYNVDKLKAPVLIVHSGEDRRVPIEQAESLIEALKKNNHTYQFELLESEGHGFYKEEHRTHYYKTVLAFLEQHMTL